MSVGTVIKVDIVDESMPDSYYPEVRLNDMMTILELKEKLYLKTGIEPSLMSLYALDPSNEAADPIHLNDNVKFISNFGIKSGYSIRIKSNEGGSSNLSVEDTIEPSIKTTNLMNTNPKLYQHYVKQLETCNDDLNESNFEKYKMSDEDYEKRSNTLKKFIQNVREGREKTL